MTVSWEIPAFTRQDRELVEAYKRAKKYLLTEREQVKAGIIVNIRETPLLNNCLVETLQLNGYPMKSAGVYITWRYHDVVTLHRDNIRRGKNWDSNSLWSPGNTAPIITKKQKKKAIGGFYTSQLRLALVFRHSARVAHLAQLLTKADRFQQHCIIRHKPYTKEVYEEWVHDINYERWQDQQLEQMLSNSR